MTTTIPRPMRKVFESTFGRDGLVSIHGSSLVLGEWRGNRRVYSFSLPPVDDVPGLLKPFLHPDGILVSVAQQKNEKNTQITVENKLRLNVLGQELFMVQPKITLTENDGQTDLTTYVRVNALLPPGADKIAEVFMIGQSQSEFRKMHLQASTLV